MIPSRPWLIPASRMGLQRLLTGLFMFVALSGIIFWFAHSQRMSIALSYFDGDERPFDLPGLNLTAIEETLLEYEEHPIEPPYKSQFWEVGKRVKMLHKWTSYTDQLNSRAQARRQIQPAIETLFSNLFPFLNTTTETPYTNLTSSFEAGSRGIVIPVGGDTALRFASHLIVSLRVVLGTKLPIQIAYAGESDLPRADRETLISLEGATDISFLDVLSVVDDSTLDLADGGWAIKAFAALKSNFEQVILMDADAVFLQPAEALFKQQAFRQHGAYLFHDRLLWQHSFRGRHEWLEDQIKEPSPYMNQSKVWTEDYAEECDSGVVVLDKSRNEVLMGLLHTAWQNTKEVRDEVTYKLMYGDKESWWLGLEMAGSGYGFEEHYGSMLGWEDACEPDSEERCICSFTISHIDDTGKLLWYNGSLLKNKHTDPDNYEIPEAWMTNGRWKKGATKADMSCMVETPVESLTNEEMKILEDSVAAAQGVDKFLELRKAP